jgi:mono/diheme cytochrome c family protein
VRSSRAARFHVAAVAAIATTALAWLVACDNREAFHELEPGLERMQVQPKVLPYGSPMRRPPPGTVPAGTGDADSRREEGLAGSTYVDRVPLPVTRALLERGRAEFERVCAACHGIVGDGASVVSDKMEMRRPPSLHEERVRGLAPGMVFAVITHGYGLMPAYDAMLDVDDRWATVAYVQALQLSQRALVADLPPAMRRELAEEAR